MLSLPESERFEREYIEQRGVAFAVLKSEFGGLWREHDEIYQEAWTAALERQRADGKVENLGGLLRVLVRNIAIDRLRKHRAETLEPTDARFTRVAAPQEAFDDAMHVRVEAARIRHVLETVEERHAAVLKWRIDEHIPVPEISRRLGISRSRAEQLVTEAHRTIERMLTAAPGEMSPWERHQRSLLVACLLGHASERQRVEAQRMVDEDPACRALLRELRASLQQVAALIPVPAIELAHPGRLARLRFDIWDRLAAARDAVGGLVSRATGSGPSVEQAAGGLAGIGGGFAAKAVLVCFAVGGGTVVCLETGVIPRDKPAKEAKQQQPKRAHPPVHDSPPPQPAVKTKAEVKPVVERAPKRIKPTPVSAPPPPSPAPTGSSEFEPTGSPAPSPIPAAAPPNSSEFEP